ncbi:hypothetical protein CR513_47124, partial [Mucuna pruriens]
MLFPIKDHKWCAIKKLEDKEWTRLLSNSFDRKIQWYLKWNKREGVICHCGTFPNIPLMGTRGCINYNLVIALRQSGYPIMSPPTKEAITPFLVHNMGPDNVGVLRSIRRAWERVGRKGPELGSRCDNSSESATSIISARLGTSIIELATSNILA